MSEPKTLPAEMASFGMDIYRAERLAQEHGFDSCTMTVIGPGGVLYGKWLDAYFGCFKPGRSDGFVFTKQLAEAGFRCLALFDGEGRQINERGEVSP